jgi:hypothetical protein
MIFPLVITWKDWVIFLLILKVKFRNNCDTYFLLVIRLNIPDCTQKAFAVACCLCLLVTPYMGPNRSLGLGAELSPSFLNALIVCSFSLEDSVPGAGSAL